MRERKKRTSSFPSKTVRRAIPRFITWCQAPGSSSRLALGIGASADSCQSNEVRGEGLRSARVVARKKAGEISPRRYARIDRRSGEGHTSRPEASRSGEMPCERRVRKERAKSPRDGTPGLEP